MACASCGAEVADDAWTAPSRGEAAKAILTDWKTWALAFGIFAVVGLITNALGVVQHTGAGGGAAVGVLIATRMTRLRVCPACKRVVG